MPAITKQVYALGSPMVIACDGVCEKAWGTNSRPRIQLSSDPDDYCLLADDELGSAPADPGTYEGDCAKPTKMNERLNKWCFRECERCTCARPGKPLHFPNLLVRNFNNPLRAAQN